MDFHIGLAEMIGFAATLIGGGWTLLRMSLIHFERRLDERFKMLDAAVSDVKRLEIDIVRSDARNAQIYVTKQDHDKILERIFKVLESMDVKLNGKISASELRTLGRD